MPDLFFNSREGKKKEMFFINCSERERVQKNEINVVELENLHQNHLVDFSGG